MKVWNLESWLALCRTNYIFNILYYSFFPHPLVPSFFLFLFFFFSFYFLIHTRQSHTHTLLSFKFPLIFVITCCLPLSSTFFPLCASSSTYQLPVQQYFISSDCSPLLTQVSHFFTVAFLFCFIFFVRYICLFHFFFLLFIYLFLVEILVL